MARLPLVAAAVAATVTFGAVLLLSGSEQAKPQRTAGGDPGLEVFSRMGCGSCHQLAAAGSNGVIGPSLDERLGSHTAASLRAKITAPQATSAMPADFDERMSDAELNTLVGFLLAARQGGSRN